MRYRAVLQRYHGRNIYQLQILRRFWVISYWSNLGIYACVDDALDAAERHAGDPIAVIWEGVR